MRSFAAQTLKNYLWFHDFLTEKMAHGLCTQIKDEVKWRNLKFNWNSNDDFEKPSVGIVIQLYIHKNNLIAQFYLRI